MQISHNFYLFSHILTYTFIYERQNIKQKNLLKSLKLKLGQGKRVREANVVG